MYKEDAQLPCLAIHMSWDYCWETSEETGIHSIQYHVISLCEHTLNFNVCMHGHERGYIISEGSAEV